MRNFIGLIGILALIVFALFNKNLEGQPTSLDDELKKPIEMPNSEPLNLLCQPVQKMETK